MTAFGTFGFAVYGVPVPMPRPRVVRGGSHTFTPREAVVAKERIREAARMLHVPFFVHRVDMKVTAFLDPEGITFWKRGSGDIDNYFKLVADALEGLAYPNDAAVTDAVLSKRPADEAGPRLEIKLSGVTGPCPPPKPKTLRGSKLIATPNVYRRST